MPVILTTNIMMKTAYLDPKDGTSKRIKVINVNMDLLVIDFIFDHKN